MATTREQFIELLKQDIEQFETAAQRIEELLPHLGAELQEQWTLTAKARRSMSTELRMLLQKAEHPAVQQHATSAGRGKKHRMWHGGGDMTGEIFTIAKGYKVFQGDPKGEPMDEPNEIQLFGWTGGSGRGGL